MTSTTFSGCGRGHGRSSNFSWWERGRGGVEVRCTIYVLGPPSHFEGVVEVCPSNFSWGRRGKDMVEVGHR